MKRILIDVNSTISLFTRGFLAGVGRSTMELVGALAELDNLPFELHLFTQNIKGIGRLNLPNTRSHHFYMPLRPTFKNISDRLRLKKHLTGYDLLHIPHNTDTTEDLPNTIFTIHDLIVYRYPEMWGLTCGERQEHKRIANGCRHIITCSEASRQDIINFWDVDPSRVTSIPWGINRQMFCPARDDEGMKALGVTRPFFFCASCNHPRKQLPLLLEAYKLYRQRGGTFQLALLGPKQTELDPYSGLLANGDIIPCRGVSDSMLNVLYTQAHATILISLAEGFGFPILESLACGTQVICSDRSCMPEVGGDVVDYIRDINPDSLADMLMRYENTPKQDTLNSDAVEGHLAQFTWRRCAERYVSIYAKLLGI